MCPSFFLSLMAKILFIAPKKITNPWPFLVFLVPITWLHAKGRQVTGTQKKKKEGLRALPFYSMKTCPNFQRTCPSTPEEFFHFIRF